MDEKIEGGMKETEGDSLFGYELHSDINNSEHRCEGSERIYLEAEEEKVLLNAVGKAGHIFSMLILGHRVKDSILDNAAIDLIFIEKRIS